VAALLAQFDESGALEGAYQALSEIARNFGIYLAISTIVQKGCCWEELSSGPPQVRGKAQSLREIRPRGLDVFALRSHIEFGQRATYQSPSFVD